MQPSWSGMGGGGGTTSGTLATMLATTGSDGQFYWNTTYKALFCWTTDRWNLVHVDTRYGYKMAPEDFTGSDRIGTLDWSNGSQLAGSLLNFGVYSISTSATSSQSRMSGQLNAFQLGTADVYLETQIQIPTLSNGTDDAVFSFGFNDGSAFDTHGACTDGAFFSLDRSVGSTWLTNTTSNGTNTQKTSSSTPVAGTPYRLGVYVNAGTSATFYVNGTAITAAHTTNLPTGAGRQTGINYRVDKTAGSGALSLSADVFDGWWFFNGQRVA